MIKSLLFYGAVFSLSTSLAHAAIIPLEGRLETSPGSGIFQAYYDPNLDVTWLADANAGAGSIYVREGQIGRMFWDNANAWVNSLTIGGVSWRLPSADVNGDGTVVDCSLAGVTEAACADNEMGFLFWEEGISRDTPSPFNNVGEVLNFNLYWSGTEVASSAWYLNFTTNFGNSDITTQSGELLAWAVSSGDVALASVPVPAAVWLFGSGLVGLIAVGRKKHKV